MFLHRILPCLPRLQVVVIGGEGQKRIARYLARLKKQSGVNLVDSTALKIHFVHDSKDQIRKRFLVGPIPATFIVNGRGIITDYILGFPTEKISAYEKFFVQKLEHESKFTE